MIPNIQPIGCEMRDYYCSGTRIGPDGNSISNKAGGMPSQSWKVCGRLCFETTKCNKWHYWMQKCYMYETCTFKKDVKKGNIAGTKECPKGKNHSVSVDF